MTDYSPAHHDYRIGDIRYDARGAYLRAANADRVAFLFDDDALERQATADKTALQVIFAARAEQVHRLVTWQRLEGRAACTCGLVVPSPDRLIGTNGHRDQRWEYERTYVVQLDGPAFVGVCQDCGGRYRTTSPDAAREWCRGHDCPDDPLAAPPADNSARPATPGESGDAGDELIPWDVAQGHRSAYPLMMLRFEARRRANQPMREIEERRLDSWLGELRELNAVVLYDPDTPDGFYLVPRQRGDDDLIRRPTRPQPRPRRKGD